MRLRSLFALLLLVLVPVGNVEAAGVRAAITWCAHLLGFPSALERFHRDFSKSLIWTTPPQEESLLAFFRESFTHDEKIFHADVRQRFLADLSGIKRGVTSNQKFVFGPGKNAADSLDVMLDFYRTLLGRDAGGDRVRRLVEWAHDEDRARFAYERLLVSRYGTDRETIRRFLDEHPLFRESIRMKDRPELLVTQAFEKETPSALITHYFRVREFSEADWFALSEEDRMLHLRRGTQRLADSPQLERNSFAPAFIGDLYREANSSKGNPVYEMKKRGYNLSPAGYRRELFTITKDFKELHSIHSHVVFYVPKNDSAEFDKFVEWFLFLNAHYHLSGMEEGLHRNTKELLSSGRSIISSLDEKHRELSRLSSFSHITSLNLKWFTVAARGEIYGASADPAMIRIGLEGRDVSRQEAKITEFVERTSHAVAARKWRGLPRDFSFPKFRIFKDRDIPVKFWNELGISAKSSARFADIFAEFTIPFNEFEKFPVVKVADDGSITSGTVSAEQSEAIRRAREHYFAELKKLAADIAESERKSGRIEDDDAIEMTIKWLLTDWAKTAKVSEIFRGF